MRDDTLSNAKQEMLLAERWIAGRQSEKLGVQAMRIAIWYHFRLHRCAQVRSIRSRQHHTFVANNPVMRLFYKYPGEYKAHLTHEGDLSRPSENGGRTLFRKGWGPSR